MADPWRDPSFCTITPNMFVFVFLIALICICQSLNSPFSPSLNQQIMLSSSLSSVSTNVQVSQVDETPQNSQSIFILQTTNPESANVQTNLFHEALSSTSAVHEALENPETTQLKHVVFGIAASAKLWNRRKNYIQAWWRPEQMRGFVWLDEAVKITKNSSLPPLKISSDISNFKYTNKEGNRSGIRISRIVSETVRMNLEDVRWIVMGDEDTFFVAENLVRVLAKYDHNQFYYIGSSSESHLQNIYFSCNMAYGGGGFAISIALAKALERMQDRCIERYPELYGSDDRIQACMAELGVPLTKEAGFHQFDLYGSVVGLLMAHPIAPLVSMHHLDIIEPIFPRVNQLQALRRLNTAMKLDSAAIVQQSICYDKSHNWTVSVSWGYAVQIFPSIVLAREAERPIRTFQNWYRKADYTAFAFNTRSPSSDPCQRPFVYVLSNALFNASTNHTASEYIRHWAPGSRCTREKPRPTDIRRVQVHKKPNPHLWDTAPRRNCCRILPSKEKHTMVIDVGKCGEDEIIEL